MSRDIVIPAKTGKEGIRSYEVNVGQSVRGLVGRIGVDDEFIVPQQFETFDIFRDEYTELMSANPTWAPGKPAGTFRQDDLWRFIDIGRLKVR